jgi:hypothetical protein
MDRGCWVVRPQRRKGERGNTLRVVQTRSALLAGEYNHNFSDDGYFEYATVLCPSKIFR